MTFAASGVAVDLLDELANAVYAIADHQHAIVLAGEVTLDQYFIADFGGDGVSGLDLFPGGQVHGNTFALIAILRLDDNCATNFEGGGPSVCGIVYRATDRYRNSSCMQQGFG